MSHPELESEQRYVTFAHACLERMRESARQFRSSFETGAGGTHQARIERDIADEKALHRLARLQLGTESLVFGRIDRMREVPDEDRSGTASTVPGADSDTDTTDIDKADERFYIGRLPVSDAEQNPIVIDWRAPVGEAFYRATGRNPMGLSRRRHFATQGSTVVGLDDEVFDLATLEAAAAHQGDHELVGTAALLAALGQARSGQMRDIVATIQAEQDEIIRSEPGGVLVVQGGPGTGKTAVALHRAAYLLYTHRFPLERQGVLVVGPNRLFMRYIGRVLPALGETGVTLAAIEELFPDAIVTGTDTPEAARVKGDVRMAKVVRRAVLTRQRALKDDLVVSYGVARLRVRAEELAQAVEGVKRAHRLHNSGRRQLQQALIERLHERYEEALSRTGRISDLAAMPTIADFTGVIRRDETFRLALDRMWPLLTPQMLLRDLYGAPALIRVAARDLLNDAEQAALIRARGDSVEDIAWTVADVALLDEAATFLGPLEKKVSQAGQPPSMWKDPAPAVTSAVHDEGVRTFGHIIVDEAQDLSPMQLRCVGRRSLNGSMTVVGDIGQATGMWAPNAWHEVLAHLPGRRAPRLVELTVGYRTPRQIMDVAARVLRRAAPQLSVPRSVRATGHPLRRVHVNELLGAQALANEVRLLQAGLEGGGTIGIIVPDAMQVDMANRLMADGVTIEAAATGPDAVAVLGVGSVKGLEFDAVLLVEPARIVAESAQGWRSLFVALTRPTRALTIVYEQPLPDELLVSAADEGAEAWAPGLSSPASGEFVELADSQVG